MSPNQASVSSGVGTAAVGTALGAAAGAAIGGGTGAAIGAGSGLAVGGLMGSSSGMSSAEINQQRYDMGYVQCMYAKGNRVPIPGQIMDNSAMGAPGGQSMSPPPPPPTGNPGVHPLHRPQAIRLLRRPDEPLRLLHPLVLTDSYS